MDGYILVEESSVGTDYSSSCCSLCEKEVSAPYYRSDEEGELKPSYLHKACADLPMEMEHKLHPSHTLSRRRLEGEQRVCNLCSFSGTSVYYSCCDCEEFVIDMKCALESNPITHKCHHHPLIPIHEEVEKFLCLACKRVDYGIAYKCTICTFHVHQHCVSSRIVKLASHDHNLELIYSLSENYSGDHICCQVCGKDMKEENYAFHCAGCRYFCHIYNCRAVVHSGHDFPLVLIKEGARAGSAFQNCYACRQQTSFPYYACSCEYYASSPKYYVCSEKLFTSHRRCTNFFLHKFCAELPQTLEHHLHPGHTLILSKPWWYREFICNACHEPWKRYNYYCAKNSCRFTIDIICVMKTLYLKREFHEHQLIYSHMKPPFACRACNKDGEGPTFQCTTCRFWVHQQCASVPKFKKYDLHPHKLKLTYALHLALKDGRKHAHCHICRGCIELHNWAYHCAGCRYYTHVHKCSDPREVEGFDYEAALAAAVCLPVTDESVSFGALFLMDTNQKEENEQKGKPPDANGEKSRRMLFLDENIETCHECAQFPSAPCNNCALCDYVLPKSPAKLTEPSLLEGYYLLRDTVEHCNGLDTCSFGNISNMRINSSVLPRYVKHEGHSHVLSTTFIDMLTWCNACEKTFRGYGFRCNIWEYTIDTYCALLPGSISHSYDKEHGFKLTYYSIEGVDEYVCEICEEDIITMWFYHCEKCDQSIHSRCIWKHHVKFGPFVKHVSPT